MCCQTDPTWSSLGLIPAFLLAIRKHNGSRLPERPCVDSPARHLPRLISIFPHLMINNAFWLGQSPIGKLSADGVTSEAPQPLARPASNNATKRGVPYIPSLPLRVSDRLMKGSGLSHICTTITHRRFVILYY
jgi:hypothetical protein